jgi:hypothetical protein
MAAMHESWTDVQAIRCFYGIATQVRYFMGECFETISLMAA